jgi:hypothetical protein
LDSWCDIAGVTWRYFPVRATDSDETLFLSILRFGK